MEIENIIRSKRKTISLEITEDASLIVRAPFDVNDETIKKVVLKRKDWTEKKREEVLSWGKRFFKKEFVSGEGFLYLGRYYKLHVVDNQQEPFIFKNGFFLLKDYLPVAPELFIIWYRNKAIEKIPERVEWYGKKRDFKYNKINITEAGKRWGSCSSKGNLNFTWRLIMAPLSVIDYVVVHELVHLVEKNHTKDFWDKVKMLMPDYKKQKDWLKKNGHLLRL